MTRRTLATSLATAALAALAACSNDSSTAPGSATAAEVALSSRQDAGENAAATLGQLTASEAASGATFSVAGPVQPSADFTVSCTGPDGMGWFSCIAVTENGLTVTRQIRFWTGTSLQLAWDSATTDSVNHHWTAGGTVNSVVRPGKVWTIADVADATMQVLRGAPPAVQRHSWSGTADRNQTSTYTVSGVERVFTHMAHDTVLAVIFQMPRALHPFPLSGTIIRNVSSLFTAGSFSRSDSRRIVVTFDGSPVAQLQDGGVTCDLDLVARTISNCH